jgi:hypothetical protein
LRDSNPERNGEIPAFVHRTLLRHLRNETPDHWGMSILLWTHSVNAERSRNTPHFAGNHRFAAQGSMAGHSRVQPYD